jgi:beta-mannosidase
MISLGGSPRVHSVSSHQRAELTGAWELCSAAPDAAATPRALDALAPAWSPATVPGTVAESMRRAGKLDIDHVPNFDDHDWWYRCQFDAEPNAEPGTRVLVFDGLATLAEVWLNDVRVLTAENMFVRHEVDVAHVLQRTNTLVLRFRSLNAMLAQRRPRPRWRTKLVEHQQLRWVRTTLLGRMPGWSPPVRPVGPWRSVWLETRALVDILDGDVMPSVTPDGSVVEARINVRPLHHVVIGRAELVVGSARTQLAVTHGDGEVTLDGTLLVRDAQLWWPHTHGDQPLYAARVVLDTDHGEVTLDFGTVAFRTITVSTANGEFTVLVNGARVFCRGACWTTPDIVTLGAPSATYDALLTAARDCGMNMIRVGGTMTYEADAFYDACDRLGVLVWQDFMFANMDYPVDDAAFMQLVTAEATGVIARLRRHPSLAILCGNSEVEQQAAMMGVGPEHWDRKLFYEMLPDLCARGAPSVRYWPASPSGGILPFQADEGVAHYYGVGGYLRPLEDARRATVRFASECLAFAHVPEQAMIDALLPAGESPVHHPRWKARVPRDHGAGWDFEDVRDHYLTALFGVDPMRLRYADMQRYLSLSRVVTGEVMARTIGEWRRAGSTCAGALVWFLQDLWAGAGWGVLDSSGRPKAAYYAIKRAMQPVALAITDEGSNGLHVHITNDHATPLVGELRVSVVRDGRTRVASATTTVSVAPRSAALVSADRVLGRFHDLGYFYRFGPPGHDLVIAALHAPSGDRLADAFHFPLGLPSVRQHSVALTADAERHTDGSVAVTVRSEEFAQYVEIDAGRSLPDDNYFHIAPGEERTIVFPPDTARLLSEGFLQPLNAHTAVRFTVPQIAEARA